MRTLLRFPLLAFLVALVLVAAGCDSSGPDDGDDNDPPSLIAAGAFSFDRSFPPSPLLSHGGDYGNFLQAYARVQIVSAAVGIHLFVPATVTAAATSAQPFVEDGTWIWSNTVPVDGSNVTFRLEGTPSGTEVDWRMRITVANLGGQAYDEFVLYEAQTALNGRSGSWQLYYRIDGARTQVLAADFEAAGTSAGEVTFTVPQTNPNTAARGSTVRYAADGDARLFDWHQEPEDYDHLVEWSEDTHAGMMTATNFNAGAPVCWDADLFNVPCTPVLQ